VHADRDVEIGLAAKPSGVGADLSRAKVLVVTVEIESGGILARGPDEAGRIEEGTDEPYGPIVEDAGFEELKECEGRGRFVAVNAGGKIDARSWARGASGQSEERGAGLLAESLDAEAGGAGGVGKADREGRWIDDGVFDRRVGMHGMDGLLGSRSFCRF